MKVLVCGSRHWTDKFSILDALADLPEGTIVVHGAADGADAMAGLAASRLGFKERPYPAKWGEYGKAAGHIRNSLMLEKEHTESEPIDLVLAFTPDLASSKGTLNMVTKAQAKGIPVRVIQF